jgi:hypothetical protein
MTLALAALLMTGCLETEFSLGPRDQSVVDRAFCGDWMLSRMDQNGQTQNSQLVVRNIDDKVYYVEWADANKPADRTRMTAFVADVKGVSFAHLQNLGEDGVNSDKHIIFRFELDDEKLVIKELSDEFFKDKIHSNEELKELIEANLENVAIYAGEPFIGTRQTK